MVEAAVIDARANASANFIDNTEFFCGKAVYVSMKWLPHLCNYRRDGYDFDARCNDGLVFYREKEIYDAVASSGELTSKQLRAKLGDSCRCRRIS